MLTREFEKKIKVLQTPISTSIGVFLLVFHNLLLQFSLKTKTKKKSERAPALAETVIDFLFFLSFNEAHSNWKWLNKYNWKLTKKKIATAAADSLQRVEMMSRNSLTIQSKLYARRFFLIISHSFPRSSSEPNPKIRENNKKLKFSSFLGLWVFFNCHGLAIIHRISSHRMWCISFEIWFIYIIMWLIRTLQSEREEFCR